MQFSTISTWLPGVSWLENSGGKWAESVLEWQGSSEEISQSEGISDGEVTERESLLLLVLLPIAGERASLFREFRGAGTGGRTNTSSESSSLTAPNPAPGGNV